LIIWQTGMALVIALAVWLERKTVAIKKPTVSAKTA